MLRKISILFLLLTFFATLSAQDRYYINSEKSKVYFQINNFGSAVTGSLPNFKVSGFFFPDNLNKSALTARFAVNSIDTDNTTRDKHLQNKKWFFEEQFPEIEFKSTSFSKDGVDSYVMEGTLTIKGIKQQIKIPFNQQSKGDYVLFTAEHTINRNDFNVGGGSLFLGEEVKVIIECVGYHSK
ncbi:MAG: YceI family protein [Luteibaculaceae bacterium]